jgi:hypothetical protein
MIIENVRVDWLSVFQPGNKGKYGVAILLPKGSPVEAQVKDAIAKAKVAAIAKGKYTEAQTKSASFKGCIHDGDAEYEAGERSKEYIGHSYINANNKDKPGIVNKAGRKILDSEPYYSGWYCTLDVNFSGFNNESKGVGAYLNHIMFVRPGERLDGRQSAEEAFKNYVSEDETDGTLE